jgi:hypothetical protein
MAKRAGSLGTTLVLALLLVVVSMAVGIGFGRFDFAERLPVVGPFFYEERAEQTTSGPVVVEGIQKLDQLATVRFTESVPITKESGGTGFERLFSGERVLLIASGEVEAGVDLSKLDRDSVIVRGETVTIRLPEAEVLSTNLNEGETRVYDRDFSPLNLRPDDGLVERARAEAEDEVRRAALENDIIGYAQSNAEESIRAFVLTLGFERVEFE